MPTVIFDLDGTLADTSGDLLAAANACFQGLGYGDLLDPHNDQLTAFAGGRAMLRLGLERQLGVADEAQVDALFETFVRHYSASIDRFSTIYPGVVEAIEGLKQRNIRTGICTNKPEGLARDLIGKLGVTHLFDSLIGADTLATSKPDPAPYVRAVSDAGGTLRRSVLIGDTITDRDTARAVGVPCVLVNFGPARAVTAAMEPDALLADYRELGSAVAPFIGV